MYKVFPRMTVTMECSASDSPRETTFMRYPERKVGVQSRRCALSPVHNAMYVSHGHFSDICLFGYNFSSSSRNTVNTSQRRTLYTTFYDGRQWRKLEESLLPEVGDEVELVRKDRSRSFRFTIPSYHRFSSAAVSVCW